MIVVIGGQKKQTKVCEGGHKNPVFNETLTFKAKEEDIVHFKLMEDDVGSDDLIGENGMVLANVFEDMSAPTQRALSIEVLYKGQQAGEIKAEIKWTPAMQQIRSSNPNVFTINQIRVALTKQQTMDKAVPALKLLPRLAGAHSPKCNRAPRSLTPISGSPAFARSCSFLSGHIRTPIQPAPHLNSFFPRLSTSQGSAGISLVCNGVGEASEPI